MKMLSGHRVLFRWHRAENNQARGLWFDIDNADIAIKNSNFADNLKDGLFLEKNQGPFTLLRNDFTGNGEHGMWVVHTSNVSMNGNHFCGNTEAPIHITSQLPPLYVWDYELGANILLSPGENWTIEHGIFVGPSTEALFVVDMPFPADEMHFVDTAVSEFNAWEELDPTMQYGDNLLDLPNWQAATGLDGTSVYAFDPTCGRW
jgi:hypothetical protein